MNTLLAFTIAGAVGLLLRASLIVFGNRLSLAEAVERAISDARYAILAALAVSSLVGPASGAWFGVSPMVVLAAGAAVYAAHRYRNVALTGIVGMSSIWALTFAGSIT